MTLLPPRAVNRRTTEHAASALERGVGAVQGPAATSPAGDPRGGREGGSHCQPCTVRSTPWLAEGLRCPRRAGSGSLSLAVAKEGVCPGGQAGGAGHSWVTRMSPATACPRQPSGRWAIERGTVSHMSVMLVYSANVSSLVSSRRLGLRPDEPPLRLPKRFGSPGEPGLRPRPAPGAPRPASIRDELRGPTRFSQPAIFRPGGAPTHPAARSQDGAVALRCTSKP